MNEQIKPTGENNTPSDSGGKVGDRGSSSAGPEKVEPIGQQGGPKPVGREKRGRPEPIKAENQADTGPVTPAQPKVLREGQEEVIKNPAGTGDHTGATNDKAERLKARRANITAAKKEAESESVLRRTDIHGRRTGPPSPETGEPTPPTGKPKTGKPAVTTLGGEPKGGPTTQPTDDDKTDTDGPTTQPTDNDDITNDEPNTQPTNGDGGKKNGKKIKTQSTLWSKLPDDPRERAILDEMLDRETRIGNLRNTYMDPKKRYGYSEKYRQRYDATILDIDKRNSDFLSKDISRRKSEAAIRRQELLIMAKRIKDAMPKEDEKGNKKIGKRAALKALSTLTPQGRAELHLEAMNAYQAKLNSPARKAVKLAFS